ncbi:MAG: hypothetical protein WBY44_18920 [Bryobacteraceae bacterium]|jgi:hypothetical protein
MILHNPFFQLVLCYLVAVPVSAQRGPQVQREEPLDIQVVIGNGLQTISTRTGERVIQDMQVRVTRRNNRRPVAAGLLIKARTPSTGPSATFGRTNSHEGEFRTDANGEFIISGLLTNGIAGSYHLEIMVDITDSDRIHYSGRETIEMKNIKGGVPGWVKYAAIAAAAAGGVGACFAGPCRPGNSTPAATTVSFGPAQVGAR